MGSSEYFGEFFNGFCGLDNQIMENGGSKICCGCRGNLKCVLMVKGLCFFDRDLRLAVKSCESTIYSGLAWT